MQWPASLTSRSAILAAVVVGSLAAFVAAGGSAMIMGKPDCRAELAAEARAEPGFVALAGSGDEACLRR